jgi:hypothetical protein
VCVNSPVFSMGFDENHGYFITPTLVSLNVAYSSIDPSFELHIAFCDFRISSINIPMQTHTKERERERERSDKEK